MEEIFNRSKLRELREARGLTQQNVADDLGIQQSRIAEAEGTGTLSMRRARQLAEYFEINWKDLLKD